MTNDNVGFVLQLSPSIVLSLQSLPETAISEGRLVCIHEIYKAHFVCGDEIASCKNDPNLDKRCTK